MTSNHLTHKFQSAYRAGHSTEIALLRIVNDILTASDANQVSTLTLLDFVGCFWHHWPLHTVEPSWTTFWCFCLALSWFKSYLSNRFQFVSASGSKSQAVPAWLWVPQGWVLGPILFVLYTQPLSQIPFNHSCPHQFFADDTRLRKSCSPEHFDDTRNALQTCLSGIKDWMTENKLQLNADKTETMLFNFSKLMHPPAPLSISQATLFFSDTVRSLVFYLDKDLSVKEHINFICKNCFPGNPTY